MLGSSVSWSHHRTVGHQQLPAHLSQQLGSLSPDGWPWTWKLQQLPHFRVSCACLADSSSSAIFWKPRHLRELEGSSGSVGGQAGSTGGFSRAVSHWMGVRESLPVGQVPRVSITKYHRLSG